MVQQPNTITISFVGFHGLIDEAVREKAMYSHLMINEADIPGIRDILQTYLIRKVGCFQLRGYVREGTLGHWFIPEVWDEFDDIYLKFRDYIRTIGIDINENYQLIRYLDQNNFILYSGQVNDPELLRNDYTLMEDCEPLSIECDPFL